MSRPAPGEKDVSFFLIFFALVAGIIIYPCNWIGKKMGIIDDGPRMERYYEDCPFEMSYICADRGYKWNGKYRKAK